MSQAAENWWRLHMRHLLLALWITSNNPFRGVRLDDPLKTRHMVYSPRLKRPFGSPSLFRAPIILSSLEPDCRYDSTSAPAASQTPTLW